MRSLCLTTCLTEQGIIELLAILSLSDYFWHPKATLQCQLAQLSFKNNSFVVEGLQL